MNNDSCRNELKVKFYCSKHPKQELTFSSSLSKMESHSAYSINPKIVINPCLECEHEIKLIKNAVNILTSINNP